MNSVLLGKYVDLNSIIHRIDSRIKIIATFLFLIAVFLTNNAYYFIFYLGFVVTISIISKVGVKNLILALKPMRFLLIFMIVFNIAFYKQGNLIFEFKFIQIYDAALLNTLFFVSRIVIIIMYSSILTLTTTPLQLAVGIEDLLSPLKIVKFPAHELGMMISIALRFIPTLFEETDKIMKAQASRGIDFKNGKIKEKVKGLTAMLIPLFVNSIKRAEDLSDAMEMRGYTDGKNRTKIHESKIGMSDIIYLVVHILVLSTLVYLRFWR